MEIDEAVKHIGPVKLPEWYAIPLRKLKTPPVINTIAIETVGSGIRSAVAEVEWTMVPWSTSRELRRFSHRFKVEDLQPA